MQRPGKEEDFVKKKKLMRSSLILQGVYTAGCILDIILCLFYQASYKTSFGRQCAYLALHLTVILLLVPALPLSLIWNIRATPPRQAEDTRLDGVDDRVSTSLHTVLDCGNVCFCCGNGRRVNGKSCERVWRSTITCDFLCIMLTCAKFVE